MDSDRGQDNVGGGSIPLGDTKPSDQDAGERERPQGAREGGNGDRKTSVQAPQRPSLIGAAGQDRGGSRKRPIGHVDTPRPPPGISSGFFADRSKVPGPPPPQQPPVPSTGPSDSKTPSVSPDAGNTDTAAADGEARAAKRRRVEPAEDKVPKKSPKKPSPIRIPSTPTSPSTVPGSVRARSDAGSGSGAGVRSPFRKRRKKKFGFGMGLIRSSRKTPRSDASSSKPTTPATASGTPGAANVDSRAGGGAPLTPAPVRAKEEPVESEQDLASTAETPRGATETPTAEKLKPMLKIPAPSTPSVSTSPRTPLPETPCSELPTPVPLPATPKPADRPPPLSKAELLTRIQAVDGDIKKTEVSIGRIKKALSERKRLEKRRPGAAASEEDAAAELVNREESAAIALAAADEIAEAPSAARARVIAANRRKSDISHRFLEHATSRLRAAVEAAATGKAAAVSGGEGGGKDEKPLKGGSKSDVKMPSMLRHPVVLISEPRDAPKYHANRMLFVRRRLRIVELLALRKMQRRHVEVDLALEHYMHGKRHKIQVARMRQAAAEAKRKAKGGARTPQRGATPGGSRWPTRRRGGDKNADHASSEADYEAILLMLQASERRKELGRINQATLPDMLAPEQRRYDRVRSENGLIEDVLAYNHMHATANPWTDQEKTVFAKKYTKFRKNFLRISEHLPRKTVNDCIAYYYLTKHILDAPRAAGVRRGKAAGALGNEGAGLPAQSRPVEKKGKLRGGYGAPTPRPFWTDVEKARFLEALDACGKDFPAISKMVETKGVDKCRNFFNNNKKKLRLDERARRAHIALGKPLQQRGRGRSSGDKARNARRQARRGARSTGGGAQGGTSRRRTSGPWTPGEREKFLAVLKVHGRDWARLAEAVPTRTHAQLKNYFQNYREKLGLAAIARAVEGPKGSKPGKGSRRASASKKSSGQTTTAVKAASTAAQKQFDGTGPSADQKSRATGAATTIGGTTSPPPNTETVEMGTLLPEQDRLIVELGVPVVNNDKQVRGPEAASGQALMVQSAQSAYLAQVAPAGRIALGTVLKRGGGARPKPRQLDATNKASSADR